MISTAKKSGSNWLTRLRTAKGFTENDAVDLENYLQNPPNPKSPIPQPDPFSAPIQNQNQQLYTIMSGVLHHLFNFGDNNSINNNLDNSKKKIRKQSNPRIWGFSRNVSDENNNVDNNIDRKGNGVEDEEEDGREVSFSGYSRTEVTVIDTSYEDWKSDKFLYRKKNVWRVGDNKKGKCDILVSKTKRKLVSLSKKEEEEERRGRKKRKGDETRGSGGEKCELNEVYFQRDKSEGHEKALEEVVKVPKTKKADMKSRSGNSSVVLIKSIPIGKKLGTSVGKTCLKSKEIKP